MNYTLEKGEVVALFFPDFGDQTGLKITKWKVEIGDIIEIGDVICEIENDEILVEYDSHYNGKIISIIDSDKKLHKGIELCKIEGI